MAEEQKPKREYRMPYPMAIQVWVLIAVVVSFLISHFSADRTPEPKAPPVSAELPTPPPSVSPGTEMLKNYGSTRQPPAQDLTDLHRVWENFTLLVKAPLPLGANEDIAAALLGKNRGKLAFVAPGAPYLNASGQLIDRWQSPLFFHAIDQRRLDIRSAGPDRQMWTADDLHRRYDGQFVIGEALNASSLFEATRDYRPRPNQ